MPRFWRSRSAVCASEPFPIGTLVTLRADAIHLSGSAVIMTLNQSSLSSLTAVSYSSKSQCLVMSLLPDAGKRVRHPWGLPLHVSTTTGTSFGFASVLIVASTSSVHLGQVEIQKYEIRPGRVDVGRLSIEKSQRLFAIGYDMDAIGNSRVSQRFLGQQSRCGTVFHEQNLYRFRQGYLPLWHLDIDTNRH